MRRVAFYGGSFDPPHNGHRAIEHALFAQFELDQFIFIPAFQAPHKSRLRPTSAYDRYAMLCLVTKDEPKISVSRMEIEMPERPFSVETLSRIKEGMPADEIFFVMGADSWMDIKTWREWEKVLTLSNHIVVTRPGYEISSGHVTEDIQARIVDLRNNSTEIKSKVKNQKSKIRDQHIYFTDFVNADISATKIRSKIRNGDVSWQNDVPAEVANYIEKYQIYT